MLNRLRRFSSQLDDLGQDLTRLTLDEMRRSHAVVSGEVYRDGLTNVLAEPEFAESDIARNALRLLEERPLLEDLLSRTVKHADVGGVQVLIGGGGHLGGAAGVHGGAGQIRRARPGDGDAGRYRPDPDVLRAHDLNGPVRGAHAQRAGY